MGLPVTVGGKVSAADVNLIASLPVANFAALPASGNWLGREVATTDTGITFRWSGSAWRLDGYVTPTSVTNGTISSTGLAAFTATTGDVTVAGAFDAATAWYEITGDLTTASSAAISIRFGSIATGYDSQTHDVTNTSNNAGQSLNATSLSLPAVAITGRHFLRMVILNPFATISPTGTFEILSTANPMVAGSGVRRGAFLQRATTSVSSLIIAASSGTLAGSVRIKRIPNNH